MKTYDCVVSIKCAVTGIEAESVEHFGQIVKESWKDNYNLTLQDNEITEITLLEEV